MKYLAITIILIVLVFTYTNKKTVMPALTSNDTILAMGDSLTYGFGGESGKSYPALLSKYTGLRVINAGMNGDTSEEGLRRLAPLLEEPSVKLMILFFGGNDVLQKKSMTDLKQNLKEMVQMAKAKQIEVLLISVPNISLFGLSPLDLYEEVSEEEDVPLLSGMLTDILSNPSLKSDQIHPNAKGYEKMAKTIYDFIEGYGWLPL